MLPIDDIFPKLEQQLKSEPRVILQAPPGAGKSTRLPLLLLQSQEYSSKNQIIILEPRRVAARQISNYLSQQLGEKVGQRIGLKMRGQSSVSAETVITIVTDGVMVRQIQQDPELKNVALVIFDEFHERALQTDLALALVLDAQELNEQLNLLIMSATLDLSKLSTALNAPVVESKGRQYPVDVQYVSSKLIPTDDDVVLAILLAINEQQSSILVFLSGVGEIKRIQQRLQDRVPDSIIICPLFGSLSIEQQTQAIEPCHDGQRKVVLSTNIAQTSLTIEGVDVVVDSGVERIVQYKTKLGTEQLVTQPISIAAAIQRAGRAGRLRAGVCYRLGSKEQFERRRNFDVADIERVDISQVLLEVQLWGAQFDELFWLSKPQASRIEQTKQQLIDLGYFEKPSQGNTHDSKVKLTPLANAYLDFPLDLRFSKMLIQAREYQTSNWKNTTINLQDILPTACVLATYLQQNNANAEGSLIAQLEYLSAQQWHQLVPYFSALTNRLKLRKIERSQVDLDAVAWLLTLAFPDRIGKKQGKQWKLSNGIGVVFHSSQVEPKSEFILVVDFNASEYGQYVRTYVELDFTQLLQMNPDLVTQDEVVIWSESKQKPERLAQEKIGKLVLSEQPLPLQLTENEWQQLWLEMIETKGWQVLSYSKPLETFLVKLNLVRQHNQTSDWPLWDKSSLIDTAQDWLLPYLSQIKNVSQLKALNIAKILFDNMEYQLQQLLQKLCPEHYQTPAGTQRKIDYLASEPKLSVKLQEMFGEPTTPSICHGKVALMIELLSPAQRPLQLTKDLANFWQNAYVEVKKEMKGRYPKHPWPDDPTTALATKKTKRQLGKAQ